jgi:hypothetical protein
MTTVPLDGAVHCARLAASMRLAPGEIAQSEDRTRLSSARPRPAATVAQCSRLGRPGAPRGPRESQARGYDARPPLPTLPSRGRWLLRVASGCFLANLHSDNF